MNELQAIKEAIHTDVYHIPTGEAIALHSHISHDEMFYCIKGIGKGLLEGKDIGLYAGDTFVAPAGKLHGLVSKHDLHIVVVQIPIKKIICTCYNVNYWDIRHAMEQGARTLDDLMKATGAGLDCGGCTTRIANLLTVACPCHDVSMEAVLDAIQNGADTVEKVAEITGCCTQNCRVLIQNMIDTGK